MIERHPFLTALAHLVLILGILIVALPIWITFVASTLTLDEILAVPMRLLPGDQLWENYRQAWNAGVSNAGSAPVGRMMLNSLVMALAIAVGKIAISIIASFAVVYFRFPLRNFFFWMIFVTLMLPVEVRIIPTFEVVSDLGMLNSYVGLTLPLIASATATFLFRQFFLTVPDELAEAARMDGASEWRVYRHVVFPHLRPVTLSALIILGHISIKVFDLIVAIGGKQLITQTPAVYMWILIYDARDYAKGAAIATLLLVGISVLVVPYLLYTVRSERRV